MKIEKGNYKGKHPAAAKPDPVILEAVKSKIVNGEVTCGDAENKAKGIKIGSCQLGAF